MILYSLYYAENHPDRERRFLGTYESKEKAQKALLTDLQVEQERLPHAHISERDYTIDEWDTDLTIWVAERFLNTQLFATAEGARAWLQAHIETHRKSLDDSFREGSLSIVWSWDTNIGRPGETIILQWERYYEGLCVERGDTSGRYYPLEVRD